MCNLFHTCDGISHTFNFYFFQHKQTHAVLIQAELANKDTEHLNATKKMQAAIAANVNETSSVIQGLENDAVKIKVGENIE